jgi:hypothetical protein
LFERYLDIYFGSDRNEEGSHLSIHRQCRLLAIATLPQEFESAMPPKADKTEST